MNNIREAMQAKGLTQQQVAEHLGVSRQAVQRWCQGFPPSTERLNALATFLGVTVGYLTGSEKATDVQFVTDAEAPLPGDEYIRVNVLDVSGACAGEIEALGEENAKIVGGVDFFKPFLRQLCGVTSLSKLDIINTIGDSMEPTISRSSFALIDRNQNLLLSDGIYCFTIAGSLFVKRVQRRPDGSLKVISDNTRYDPFIIEPHDSERTIIIGRVVYVFNGMRL